MYLNSRIEWALTLIFLLLSAILSQPVQGATYYVKPTGDNTKSGLTEALAWKNINKACSTLVAGDTVLIRAGRYDEPSAYKGNLMGADANGNDREYGLRPKTSGTVGNPIVFKGYPGDVRPVLIGKSNAARTDLRTASLLYGLQYIIIDSLEFRFGSNGVDLGNSSYNIIRNCIVDSTLGSDDQNNGGVMFYKGKEYNNTYMNIVEGCMLFANGGWNGATPAYTDDANTAGIENYYCDSCTFRNNTIHDEYIGVYLKGSARYSEIYGNTIYNIAFTALNTVQGGCTSCSTSYNGGPDYTDAIFHHNVVYHSNICFEIADGRAAQTPPELDSLIYFYNNTCDCNNTGVGILGRYGRWNKSYFFNNIIYKPLWSSDYRTAMGFGMKNFWVPGSYIYPTEFYEDYNLFYGLGDANTGKYYDWEPLAEMTLNYWKDHLPTGVVTGSGAHNTIADPLFDSVAVHDYGLKPNSPAATGGKGGSFTFYPGTGRAKTITLPTYRGAIPPTTTLTTSPSSLPVGGGPTTLTWISASSDSVVIRNQVTNQRISGSTLDSGSTPTTLTATTTYVATAYKVPNNTTALATVTVAAADTTKPVIGAVQATSITASSATITWTTNEPATSQVNYGLTQPSYSSSTTLDPAYVTSHSQPLTGLTAGTLYHCRVRSRDAASNEAIGTDFTFTTTAAPADTTMVNYALGRVASVSGTYPDPVYTVAAITNGIIAPRTPAATWASDQSALAHWVEVDFGAVRPVSRVRIWWAWNSARAAWMTSNQYTIQSWNGTSYTDIVTVTSPPIDSVRMTSFAPVSTSRVRIYQPANMGPLTYPTILWLTEFEVLGSQDTIPPATIRDLQ